MKRGIIVIICIILFLVGCGEENPTPNIDQERIVGDVPDKIARIGGNSEKCSGSGPIEFTHSPMELEDFSHIEPYGLVTGAHVTPIDHQYFAPADFNSAIDAYEVFAIADGHITSIQRRDRHGSSSGVKEEFRLVFQHSCDFFSYFDLVTSLREDINEEMNEKDYASTWIPVEGGELIGRIGAQTLDFAVWDLQQELTGYVSPELYEGEPWKIHTVDPLPHFVEPVRLQLLNKMARKIEPRSGKIDLDIPGKLVGNWFLEGTNGYASGEGNYWTGHLAIVYNAINSEDIIISIGDYYGKALQFNVVGNTPNPANVSVGKVVIYELTSFAGPGIPDGNPSGAVIFEVLPEERLKMEIFSEGSQVNGFTGKEVIYER